MPPCAMLRSVVFTAISSAQSRLALVLRAEVEMNAEAAHRATSAAETSARRRSRPRDNRTSPTDRRRPFAKPPRSSSPAAMPPHPDAPAASPPRSHARSSTPLRSSVHTFDISVQQRLESHAAIRVLRRIISAAVERLQLRREEHAHRPAAVTARSLHVGHVSQVHVRPLLAVHLHRHKLAR